MKIIETIISIITPLLGVLLPLFWNKLKGYRTKILSFLKFLLGSLVLINKDLLPMLAEAFNISTVKVAALTVMLMALVDYLVRLVTDTPAGQLGDLPEKFRAKKK